jgi:hypothetical protein
MSRGRSPKFLGPCFRRFPPRGGSIRRTLFSLVALNEDSFEVSRQRPAGESWSTELTVVYRREGLDKR